MADEAGGGTRLPLFFFGTLMDGDVLARVLDRHVQDPELAPALLWGYRRHAVVGAPYPVIRPDADRHVRGVLFRPRSDDERGRIAHFESEEYEARRVRVQVGTRLAEALAYRDIDGVFELSDEAWCLERFGRVDKPGYLAACGGWMADYAGAL